MFEVLSGTLIHNHGPIGTMGRVVGFCGEDGNPDALWGTHFPSPTSDKGRGGLLGCHTDLYCLD